MDGDSVGFDTRPYLHKLFELDDEDKELEASLSIPIPEDEAYRIQTLREINLQNETENAATFDRFTSMCSRIFEVRLLASATLLDKQALP